MRWPVTILMTFRAIERFFAFTAALSTSGVTDSAQILLVSYTVQNVLLLGCE
jgi:hypothetical protein